MIKKYTGETVLEAFYGRMKYIFEEFDNIFISFSGGKDSGLLLNLLLDYRDKYYPNRVIGVFHQDFEAQYSVTTEYVEHTFERIKNRVEPYWVCLPMATRTALSNYEMYWYPWDDKHRDVWVREMPDHPYVINIENNPITTYKYKMHQEDLARQFGRWYKMRHGEGKTVCLLGMRTDESLKRYNGIVNKKYSYKGECWITRQFKDVWTASPLYDWKISDVWHAYFHFGYDYNRIYDLFYMAGLSPDKMRVASPFNDYAKDSLNLYRVIDPEMWTKLLGRVSGANFGAIYGRTKALGYRNLTPPPGHNWESYTKFLLSTLPPRVRNSYLKKFRTSIDFWHNVGGGLDNETIRDLVEKGYNIKRNGVSNYTVMKNTRIIFVGKIHDDTDDIKTSKDIPSWKRMCYCILRNDHICRFMGFGISREQQKKVDELRKKYSRVGENDDI